MQEAENAPAEQAAKQAKRVVRVEALSVSRFDTLTGQSMQRPRGVLHPETGPAGWVPGLGGGFSMSEATNSFWYFGKVRPPPRLPFRRPSAG